MVQVAQAEVRYVMEENKDQLHTLASDIHSTMYRCLVQLTSLLENRDAQTNARPSLEMNREIAIELNRYLDEILEEKNTPKKNKEELKSQNEEEKPLSTLGKINEFLSMSPEDLVRKHKKEEGIFQGERHLSSITGILWKTDLDVIEDTCRGFFEKLIKLAEDIGFENLEKGDDPLKVDETLDIVLFAVKFADYSPKRAIDFITSLQREAGQQVLTAVLRQKFITDVDWVFEHLFKLRKTETISELLKEFLENKSISYANKKNHFSKISNVARQFENWLHRAKVFSALAVLIQQNEKNDEENDEYLREIPEFWAKAKTRKTIAGLMRMGNIDSALKQIGEIELDTLKKEALVELLSTFKKDPQPGTVFKNLVEIIERVDLIKKPEEKYTLLTEVIIALVTHYDRQNTESNISIVSTLFTIFKKMKNEKSQWLLLLFIQTVPFIEKLLGKDLTNQIWREFISAKPQV
jgi:hypothetical protein